METIYRHYTDASGTISRAGYSVDQEPPLIPDGCTEITEAEYEELHAAWKMSVEAHNAEMRRQDEEQVLNNFTGLVNAGVPADVARNLTGYQGPWPV